MNRLDRKERAAIIRALVEGNSIRSTTRITGRSINTVLKLLADLGDACERFLDDTLIDLPATRIECDEIWAFCHSKERNVPEDRKAEIGVGDVWTWVALDPDTKLVVTWLVGERDTASCNAFLYDLSLRLRDRVTLTTDGYHPYLDAVERAFGPDIDYAMLIKQYGVDDNQAASPTARRYSPNRVTSEHVRVIKGNPEGVSTSYIERQNLTMRMGMRRFTRLTNGFSKKFDNHAHAVALHFMYMNFARPHKSLANPYPRTPAMAAGIADHIWTYEEIAGLLD
ncbi:MAG: IS1 family transposase [Chloroflexota bacterium]